MKVDKMSISMDAHTAARVREAARQAGVSLSAWLTEAAEARLRREAFGEFMAAFEAEHGRVTDEERRAARTDLGLA